MAESDLFVNTGYLRDHVSKLRAERRIALELQDTLYAMRHVADEDQRYKLNPILRDAERLVAYFQMMADAVDEICDDAVHLSRTMGRIIEDDTARTHHAVSKSFAL